jgi:hypothetical protein
MTSLVLLVECLAGAALPLVFLAKRWLDVRRDFFMLAIYLQALAYVFFGPLQRLRSMTEPPLAAYETLASAAFPLVMVLFLITYLWLVKGTRVTRPPARRLEANGRRLELVLYAFLAFSIAYWTIAVASDLVYRRIGNPIVILQLRLRFVEFVIYRMYIESLFFITAIVVLALVIEGRQLSVFGRAAAVLTLLSSYGYYVINSRIGLALALLVALGVWSLFWTGSRGFWPRFVAGGVACLLVLLYSNSTTQRIRLSVGKTGSVGWRVFVPGIPVEPERVKVATRRRPHVLGARAEAPADEEVALDLPDLVQKTLFFKTSVEMPMSVRLDGLDLMARMKPALESAGYAWGKAWKVPVALVYLPVVDPAKAREYKLSLDMAAKNYLMRQYTDIKDADYVSCMLTDAYGNFGYLGFLMLGLFLGTATGLSTRAMVGLTSAAWALVGLFAISHLIVFEQEFVSALLLWTKKLPFLLAILIAAPFRVVRTGASQA